MGYSPYLRRLEWIGSTGTQYINTGVMPDFAGGDSVEIHAYRGSFTGAQPCLFGSRETGIRNGVYALPGVITMCDSSWRTENFTEYTIGDYSAYVNDATIVVNGATFSVDRRVTCGLPIFLFALNNYGTETYGIYSGMKLYSWKYCRNGVLAQDLIPVLDRSGVPCMFDTVTKNRFYNAGTGTFDYA